MPESADAVKLLPQYILVPLDICQQVDIKYVIFLIHSKRSSKFGDETTFAL